MLGVLEQNIDRLKAGWRMVPREPTPEMIAAADELTGYQFSEVETIWRAMFDAFQASA
jgi:hypothetical protein